MKTKRAGLLQGRPKVQFFKWRMHNRNVLTIPGQGKGISAEHQKLFYPTLIKAVTKLISQRGPTSTGFTLLKVYGMKWRIRWGLKTTDTDRSRRKVLVSTINPLTEAYFSETREGWFKYRETAFPGKQWVTP